MNASLAAVQSSTSVAYLATVLAYHKAVQDVNAMHGSTDELLGRAYKCMEGAISALRAEGTRHAEIARLEAMAHELAPTYERNRNLYFQLVERRALARNALGFERNVARNLFALADEIGDDTQADEELGAKIREVAGMIDVEDCSL